MEDQLTEDEPAAGEPKAEEGPLTGRNNPLPESTITQYLVTREKLIRKIKKLEQREVSFKGEDEKAEKFIIDNENKIKRALIDIEKRLLENGLLLDEDEEVQALYSDIPLAKIAVSETGNELLNQKLTHILSERIRAKKSTTTLSFEEINDVVREVRAEQGESSNIPDPEHEGAAFLDLLEYVALVVARAHQNFISRQFLDSLDFFVPESDRAQCSTLPELSAEMKQRLSNVGKRVPDEIFHMEMQAAGRWEKEHPEESAPGDEIDVCLESGSDGDEEEEVEDEFEDEESQCGHSSPLSGNRLLVTCQEGGSDNTAEANAADIDLSQHDPDKVGKLGASEHTAQNMNGEEVYKRGVDSSSDHVGGECVVKNRHGTVLSPPSGIPPSSDLSDVECVTALEKVCGEEAIPSKRQRLAKQNSSTSITPPKVVDVICIDD